MRKPNRVNIVAIAEPIGNLVNDEELFDAMKRCSSRGDPARPALNSTKIGQFLNMYSALVPLLFGEKHLKDIVKITSVIEGVPVKTLLEMPGIDLINDVREAWKEQIAPFFGFAGQQA